MKQKFKELYIDIAERVSEMSSAKRMKAGCIIVKDNQIISLGYNGTPSGWDNNCEDEVDGKLVTKPEVLHAEMNAVSKLAKSTMSGDNAAMFITHSPCMECAKLIYQSGIKQVFYKHEYRSDDGKNFLTKSGIQVEILNDRR